jgi:hypothetical protein
MPTDESYSSIEADCGIAREQADSALEKEALVEKELEKVRSENVDPGEKAGATKLVTEAAKAAGEAARKSREAAARARKTLREVGTRPDEAPPGLRQQVEEAIYAADEAGKAAQDADDFRKEAISTFAVEEKLQVKEFFETHKKQIFERLKESDSIAQAAPTNSKMTFIAESLPIIHSIIQVGTSRSTLHQASQWVRDTWGPDTDPLITLSALLFIYVADQGAAENEGDEVWKRINDRVQKLMRGP